MEAYKIDQNIKSYSLTVDEPHLSSYRRGEDITYQAGDQVIVSITKTPAPGSLVLVNKGHENRLCRYENINGHPYLFPPLEIDPSDYKEAVVGQVIDHVRIKKWLSIEN